MLIDAGYVYYSEQNRLFKVKYTEEEFKPVEVKSFLSKKEQILSINKYDDLYIVRARHPGFNPINKFLFGHHPSIYTEYVCKLKDNELIKIKELKEP